MTLARLEDVLAAYPDLRIRGESEGLRLYPSPPHVKGHPLRKAFGRSKELWAESRQLLAECSA